MNAINASLCRFHLALTFALGLAAVAPTFARAEPVKTFSKAERNERFRKAIEPAFDAWFALRKAEISLPPLPPGTPAPPERGQLSNRAYGAYQSFVDAVREAWPYSLPAPSTAGPQASPAAKALEAAFEFKQSNYYTDQVATREEAVARYLQVAEEFPGTVHHDEALFNAAMLYIQNLSNGAKYDEPSAQKIFERAANRPGAPSIWTMRAIENLTGFSSDPAERMKARSNLLLELDVMEQPDEFKKRLFDPSTHGTPDEFARGISDMLREIVAVRRTTAPNMVTAAGQTAERRKNFAEIQKFHAGDKVVQAAIERRGGVPADIARPKEPQTSRSLIILANALAVAGIVAVMVIRRVWFKRSRLGTD